MGAGQSRPSSAKSRDSQGAPSQQGTVSPGQSNGSNPYPIENTPVQPSGAERTIQALQELQKTLHVLTPAEQWEVKRAMSFATTEWQEGLALSLKPAKAGFGESVHGESNFVGVETAVQQRVRLTPDSEKVILVLVGIPARGKSMYGNKLEQ